jgi:ATP-dependent RNA helicase SUPV3L1/SUV3
MEDLIKISNLTDPINWYPGARSMRRKIIYHAGPTNSGKTYAALEHFKKSKSGVYCGPLKLLATEIYKKCNESGIPCDMMTGDERLFGNKNQQPSPHFACTIEMASVDMPYEVAIIDEIQMIADSQRGANWTRALLGIQADAIHLCGDRTAINIVEDICLLTGDDFELVEYERKSDLVLLDKAIVDLKNVQPGDCIVCFSKLQVHKIYNFLEKAGYNVTYIYGPMPPKVKLAQVEILFHFY